MMNVDDLFLVERAHVFCSRRRGRNDGRGSRTGAGSKSRSGIGGRFSFTDEQKLIAVRGVASPPMCRPGEVRCRPSTTSAVPEGGCRAGYAMRRRHHALARCRQASHGRAVVRIGTRARGSTATSPVRSDGVTIQTLSPMGHYGVNIGFSDGHAPRHLPVELSDRIDR